MKPIQYLGAMGALAAAMGLGGCTPHTTGTTEIGVKYCKFWCGASKVDVVPAGQTVFFAPIKNDWYILDTAMQTSEMTRSPSSGDRATRDDLIFKTREGNDIGLDVILTWKIDPAKAQEIVERVGTNMEAIREKYVRPIARSVVRDYLNRLTSNAFYEGQQRFKEAENATAELKARLAPYGVIVDQVNLRDYKFEDDKFQEAINDAKTYAQAAEGFDRQIKSEQEGWIKKYQEQVGISNQKIAEATGTLNQTKLTADAHYVENQQAAEAILSEKEAEASAIVKMRQAMASRGGNIAVLTEYVHNFKPDTITVLPCDEGGSGVTVNRLDLNRLLDAEKAKEGAQ